MPRVVTLEEWWERYGWEPCTGPMRNTIARSGVIPDEIRDAWNVATQVERAACAVLAETVKVYCDGRCDEMGCRGHDEGSPEIAAAIRARGNP